MSKYIDKFVYYMIEKLNYEGIRIAEIENVQEAQVLFKKGEEYNHYIVLLDQNNMKDYLTYREVINFNSDKISEIIFLVHGEEVTRTTNTFLKNLVEMDIASVVFMDESKGQCVNLSKCTEGIFREIQRQATEANRTNKSGFEGIMYSFKKYKATMALAIINIVVFIVVALQAKSLDGFILKSTIYFKGALSSVDAYVDQWYRIITSGFLHADLGHLLSNMVGIIFIGIVIEELFGKWKFCTIYLTSVIVGSVGSLILLENMWSVGASGGVFGLLGAEIAYGFIMRKRLGKSYLNRLVRGAMIMILVGVMTPDVNNVAHIGGLLGGLAAGLILKPKVRVN